MTLKDLVEVDDEGWTGLSKARHCGWEYGSKGNCRWRPSKKGRKRMSCLLHIHGICGNYYLDSTEYP
jgi:hypothetical protein